VNNKPLLRTIREEFAKGNLIFFGYFADDIKWNILADTLIIGKEQVLEVSKMLQLESFPVITIKNVVAEGNFAVVESTRKASTKMERLMIRPIVMFFNLITRNFRKSPLTLIQHSAMKH